MIRITPSIFINESEITYIFTTSQGPGGQNVNKVATAVQLRFDALHSSSLPENVRNRLFSLAGKRMTTQGELIIKASRFRQQDRNKQDALNRLIELIKRAATPLKIRRKTKPTKASKQKRLNNKKHLAEKKSLRRDL